MANNSFLSIPLKKTYDISMVEPLNSFIKHQYTPHTNPFETVKNFITGKSSGDAPPDQTENVTEFNKLRYKATVQPLDKHESSLEVISRYYDQLVAIEGKLPMTPTSIPINFKWKDAFDRGSLFSSSSSLSLTYGTYERACVLFNIAALQSQIAAAQPLSTEEEVKTAAKMFQQAAGVLNMLKNHVLSWVPQEPTADLSPDTLQALAALMLAQAQDAIYIKACKGQMKPGIRAKIAAQCAEFYQDANKLMSRDNCKSLWERDWLSTVTGKQLAFQALAHFHKSQECKENKEIGEELSRLIEATNLMNKARSYTSNSTLQKEQQAIQIAHDAAKKDNDFIYHERIPDVSKLATIEKAVLAKPQMPHGHMSTRFKDLFGDLCPLAVSQAVAAFDARKSQLVNAEVGRLREHTQLLNGILASLNLPAALDDAQGGQTLPESLRDKSAKVKGDGGVQLLDKLVGELPQMANRNKEILDEMQRVLNEEKESDDQLRSQFKEKWARVPSDRLTAPLWQDVGKNRTMMDTAMNADQIVRRKYEQHRPMIELLSKPEPELKAVIPSVSGKQTQGNDAVVKELRELMQQVERLRSEREHLEKQLKEKDFDMTTEFLKGMTVSGAINEEQLSQQKLSEAYDDLKKAVANSVDNQEQLAKKIQEANVRFTQGKGAGAGVERETMLKNLATAHDAFFEIKSNLNEGQKFYNDFTPILLQVQQKIGDFVFARKTEKEDLMRELQQNIISGGQSSTADTTTKSQAPARPPPPQFTQANVQQQSAPPPLAANPAYQGQQQPYYAPPMGQMPYPVPGQPMPYPPQPYPQQVWMPPSYLPYGTYPGAQPPVPGQMPPYPGYQQPGATNQADASSPWHQKPQ